LTRLYACRRGSDRYCKSQETEPTIGAECQYVIVMEPGQRSLHEACQKERLEGYNVAEILSCFRCILLCVQVLHAEGIVHANLKQHNVLCVDVASKRAGKQGLGIVNEKKQHEASAQFAQLNDDAKLAPLAVGCSVAFSREIEYSLIDEYWTHTVSDLAMNSNHRLRVPG
jgi:hypothetical protein